MYAREEATNACATVLRDLVASVADIPEIGAFDLQVSPGGQQSNYSPVSWVRLYSRAYSPSVLGGFYLIYLFAADGARAYLSLSQGTSEFRSGDWHSINDRDALLARAAETRTRLVDLDLSPTERALHAAIDLSRSQAPVKAQAKRRIRDHEDGAIFAYEYNRADIPAHDELLADVTRMLPGLVRLYGATVTWTGATAHQPGSPVEAKLRAILRGQGRQQDPLVRQAVERYAETLAERHFTRNGWTVDRVGRFSPGYDLYCEHPDGRRLHVEVKGSQTPAEKVILTRGEVEHNWSAGECDAEHALYVVSSVDVADSTTEVSCSGGREQCIWPWTIDPEALESLQYAYRVPTEDSRSSGG
jgi:hypothetical protein